MDTISPEVKTALVTGTDHGVGFSLAKKLLSRGYFVIAVRVDETEKQIDALQSSYPDQMAIVCADIGSDETKRDHLRQDAGKRDQGEAL